jgi:hypothetical protein
MAGWIAICAAQGSASQPVPEMIAAHVTLSP